MCFDTSAAMETKQYMTESSCVGRAQPFRIAYRISTTPYVGMGEYAGKDDVTVFRGMRLKLLSN